VDIPFPKPFSSGMCMLLVCNFMQLSQLL
jgi:hypothetical protein